LPGAEPFSHDGGRIGVVVCHGFTGSPASMRPWAQSLADAGLSVRLPRLPGHGTCWQDLQLTRWPDWFATVDRAFAALRRDCDAVFVAGLSMGATLALRLAETRGDQVAGIIVVNPSLMDRRPSLRALPLAEKIVPTARGIGNDVAKPGVREDGYGRTPLRALRSLTQLWALTRADLDCIEAPILVFRSAVDHVVDPANADLLLARIKSADVEERVLQRSFHVATIDYDAELIFADSLAFIRRLTGNTVAQPPISGQD
jgi:carboxylesterase